MTILGVLLIHYDSIIAGSSVRSDQFFNRLSTVSVKGRVIDQRAEGADEHLKKLAKRYLGIGKYYYTESNRRQVVLNNKPEKVMGLSIHPAFYFLAYSPWNRHTEYIEYESEKLR